jgi:rubredoxin
MARTAKQTKNVESNSTMKCQVCRQVYNPRCDYRQGRCPGHRAWFDNFGFDRIVKFFTGKKSS